MSVTSTRGHWSRRASFALGGSTRSTASTSPRRSSRWEGNNSTKLESALRVLLIHFLKWDHQPNLRSRNWILSIAAQRAEIDDIIGDNPGLKPRIDEAVGAGLPQGIAAARETDLEIDAFPERCAYGWDEIINREFRR